MDKGQNNKRLDALLLHDRADEKVRSFSLIKIPFYLRFYYWGENWFSHNLDEEIRKAEPFIWLMLPFFAGILFYFQAPQEPDLATLIAVSLVVAYVTWFFREKGKAFYIALGLLFFISAFTLSALHSTFSGAPAISEKIIVKLEGVIEVYEKRADGSKRLVLGDLRALEKQYDLPKRVRLRVAAKKFKANVNDRLQFLAELSPPPGPVYPGGYDFARNLYFKGIGATGFIYGTPEIIESAQNSLSFSILVRQWRQNIARKINQAFLVNESENLAGIASALLVGERGQIENDVRDSLATSGLAHILAISGLHMALVVATVIMVLRSLFARVEMLALNYPVRAISVVGGIVTGSFYYLLSGGSISASRAFIMVIIMAFALLVGRKALSVRNVALAAFLLLLLAPEALLGPGFQMSFAATLSLIAFSAYWVSKNNEIEEEGKLTFLSKTVVLYVKGLVVTSLIAGLATGLFAAFHFHQVAPLGLLANLLALPVFTIMIMPFGFLGLLLMPFGYEIYPFYVMGLGINSVLEISSFVNQLTGAYAQTGLLNSKVFFIMALLLILTCLLKSRLKWLSLTLLFGAALFLKQGEKPRLLIAEDGKTIAFKTNKDTLLVSGKRAGRFEVKVWKAALAIADNEKKKASNEMMECSKMHCTIKHGNLLITHVKKAEAFSKHCKQGSVIITPLNASDYCKSKAQVIDKEILRQSGSHMGYLNKGQSKKATFHFKTAIPLIKRPWHSHYQTVKLNIDE